MSATLASDIALNQASTAREVKGCARPPVDTETKLSRDAPASCDIAELTRAIVRGDETAFSRFYDLFAPRLFGFLLVVTSGQEDLTRELHQTVMIKAAAKPHIFANEDALWAWLTQIGRNAYIDYVRKSMRGTSRMARECSDENAGTADSSRNDLLLVCLDDAIEELNEAERSLVDSIYVHRRAQAEVALETGQTTKAVESKLARIRARLRKTILTKLKHEDR